MINMRHGYQKNAHHLKTPNIQHYLPTKNKQNLIRIRNGAGFEYNENLERIRIQSFWFRSELGISNFRLYAQLRFIVGYVNLYA